MRGVHSILTFRADFVHTLPTGTVCPSGLTCSQKQADKSYSCRAPYAYSTRFFQGVAPTSTQCSNWVNFWFTFQQSYWTKVGDLDHERLLDLFRWIATGAPSWQVPCVKSARFARLVAVLSRGHAKSDIPTGLHHTFL
jgi:hypothetical protein